MMPVGKKLPARLVSILVWSVIALLLTIYAVAAAKYFPPMIWADSASGFHIWDSMQAGAAWNNYYDVDVTNIAHDVSFFRTWWSPGQYFFPGLFMHAGISIGLASVLTAWLGTAIGLVGCWRLFKAWEFSAPVVNISVFLLAAGWQTSFLFGMFNGGEIALFAGFPWIALAAYRLAHKPLLLIVFLPPLFLTGAFLKLSFPIIALALSAGIWLGRDPKPARLDRKAWTLAAALGVAFVIFYLVLRAAFLSKGPTPGDGGTIAFSLAQFGYSLTGPLFATGAFGSLLARITLFPGAPLFASWEELRWVLLLLAVPSVVLYVLVWKAAPNYRYKGMVLGMVGSYIAIFMVLYFLGASISTDDRHFRPAAIVLLPGLIHLFYSSRAWWSRALLIGFVFLVSSYGIAGFINRSNYIHRADNVGPRGFTQSNISAAATQRLNALQLAAPAGGNQIFYTASPEVALDYTRVRVMQTHSEQEDIPQLQQKRYAGRVDDLLIVASRAVTAEKVGIILRSFTSYDPSAWHHSKVGDCDLYYQGTWLQSELKGETAPSFALSTVTQ